MGELKILKLSNGSMVIAEVVNEERNNIAALNPFELVEREDDGKVIYFMDYWLPFDKKENLVGINRDHVLATVPVTEALKKYYERVRAAMIEAGEQSQVYVEDEDDDMGVWGSKPTIQ